MKELSFNIHNETQYDLHTDINYWVEHNKRHESDIVFNNTEIKLKYLLEKYPHVRALAIDIGSGAGWLSNKLSEYFDSVIGIEPSQRALDIASNLYGNKKNILFNLGFSEDVLPTISLPDEPILFVTCSVFQHLDDEYVSKTLSWINQNAPEGSILSFQELWGSNSHEPFKHIRTKTWWNEQLSNWTLDFHGPMVLPNTNKGIHGLKTKKNE
jgi:hypothetical protein